MSLAIAARAGATATAPDPRPGMGGPALVHVRHADRAMGGRLDVHLAVEPSLVAGAASVGGGVARRVRAWEARLTRFSPTSELSSVNAATRPAVPVSATFGAVLEWAREAGRLTAGLVDVALLGERLAAESERESDGAATGATRNGTHRASEDGMGDRPSWRLDPPGGWAARRPRTLVRAPGLRLDLDGVAKGWIADRALELVPGAPGAVVDADGDIAVRVAPGDAWEIGIADPRSPGLDLAVLRLAAGTLPRRLGVATSGVTVHRWPGTAASGTSPRIAGNAAPARHHLIDPRTRRPAATDLLQVTVLAADARTAEALAKAAVILGAAEGTAFLEASPALGAVLLPATGGAFALPRTLGWLA